VLAEIYKSCGVALIAIALSAVLKSKSIQIAPYVTQISAIIIIISSVSALMPVFSYIRELSSGQANGLNNVYIVVLAGAIAFVGGIASELCKENGENMLKNALDFSVNANILLLSLPLIRELVVKATDILKL